MKIDDLWVVKGGGLLSQAKSILQEVSFTVKAGEFVGVVGPNGAGKTTLLRAIVGERPAHGHIWLATGNALDDDYEELYDNPEYWLRQIGYVPVDNVLHEELTVRQALMHVGRLRLPDRSDMDIEAKMLLNLEKLGFGEDDARLDQPVRTLSSGERKKVNAAAELLTDPPLLLLDEPTSNLDPNAERDLMDSLKRLAGSNNNGNGPTILLITHTLDTLDRCDQVVFIANSHLEEFGPPEIVYNNLEVKLRERGAEIPETSERFEHWAAIFETFKTNNAIARRDRKPPVSVRYASAPERQLETSRFFDQLRILFSRYYLGKYNDISGIITILLSGFIAGFLLLIAPSDVFLPADDATAARQTVVLYTILIVIMGAFSSHREVSKEFRIFLHERAKGLNVLAYTLARVIWMSLIIALFTSTMILALSGFPLARWLSVILALVVIAIGLATLFHPRARSQRTGQQTTLIRVGQVILAGLPLLLAAVVQLQNKQLPDFGWNIAQVEIIAAVSMVLSGIAAVSLGILISASVGVNNDRATQIVIAVIMFNVILAFSVLVIGNSEFEGFFNFMEPLAATHWAYHGFSSGLSLYCWAGQFRFENFNSIGHISATWLFLTTHTMVSVALTVFVLRLQETWTPQRRLYHNLFIKEFQSTLVTFLTVGVLLSWGLFLFGQSQQYADLTYTDILFGSRRYAQVSDVAGLSGLQQSNGQFNQSVCLEPGGSRVQNPFRIAMMGE
jgi:ABC-type multidrug transport system ATPase subunit